MENNYYLRCHGSSPIYIKLHISFDSINLGNDDTYLYLTKSILTNLKLQLLQNPHHLMVCCTQQYARDTFHLHSEPLGVHILILVFNAFWRKTNVILLHSLLYLGTHVACHVDFNFKVQAILNHRARNPLRQFILRENLFFQRFSFSYLLG